MIGIRAALVLYAVLLVTSLLALKGPALALALVVVLGLAVKSYVHHLRSRWE